MLLDEILVQIGEYGRFQKRITFFIMLVAVMSALTTFSTVFLSAKTDHWCSAADYQLNCIDLGLNDYIEEKCDEFIKNVTIPSKVEDGKVVFEQCVRYDLVGVDPGDELDKDNLTTEACRDGWEYDRSQFKMTTVQDFNLVCENKDVVQLSNAAYFSGYLIGVFIVGLLSDRLGRYPTYFITLAAWLVSGIIAAFSRSFTAFAIMRFFVGATSLTTMPAYVMCCEIVGPSKRPMIGNVIWLFFGLGYMLISVMAYFIREWRHLQLAATLPLVLFFFLIPVLFESPRWLLSRGKYKEAEKILRKAAKENKVELPEVLFDEKEDKEQSTKSGTPLDLLRTPNLRLRTIILCYIWFVNNMVYYGIALSTSDLGVNVYVAAFVAGALEIPAYLSCWFLLDKFGRRLPLCGCLGVSGAACVISALMAPGVGRTVVAMIGKFAITASFSSIYVFSTEIYPTPVRTIGMSMSSMCARISGIIAPFILILGNHWAQLPFFIFGANAILACFLTLLLPETNKTKLPQTIEEGENFGGNTRNIWSCLSKGQNNNYKPTPLSEDANDNKPKPVTV